VKLRCMGIRSRYAMRDLLMSMKDVDGRRLSQLSAALLYLSHYSKADRVMLKTKHANIAQSWPCASVHRAGGVIST
jgi:hypothetical protein